MQKAIVENFDTDHPYALIYPVLVLKEAPDGHRVWHPWHHPLTTWVSKSSMDYRVHEPGSAKLKAARKRRKEVIKQLGS